MCVHLGFDTAVISRPEHPVQRRILAFCARMVDEDVARLPIGVDGCGIPVFATPLAQCGPRLRAARHARGLDADDARCARARAGRDGRAAALRRGNRPLDTALMEATAGRIVCKAGAEGVHGDALRREGLGLALKVVDGARRAAPPAVIALLEELGALEPGERATARGVRGPDVLNVAGRRRRIEAARETIATGGAS
jgi:L-asparaginase II